MKHLRKSILTLLALTLFGGAGAWAQTDYYVVGTFNGWGQNDSYKMTYTDYVNAYTFTLDLSTSDMVKVASFDGGAQFYPGDVGNAYGENGEIPANGTYTIYFRPQHDSTNWFGGYFKVVAGTLPDPPAEAIELTKAGANQWSLGQTPDYDLELQVEYYEAHALKEIPAGWTVMVNGIEQQTPYQGDSLMITETDSVTLIPAGNPRRVKSVTLEDEAPALQSLQVGGVFPGTFYYLPGETWEQAIENHPTENNGWSTWYIYVLHGDYYLEYTNDSYVNHTDPIDPTAGYLTE